MNIINYKLIELSGWEMLTECYTLNIMLMYYYVCSVSYCDVIMCVYCVVID